MVLLRIMVTPEAPQIEGFRQVGGLDVVFDIPSVHYEGPSGITMRLSEDGMRATSEVPGFEEQMDDVAQAVIARNDEPWERQRMQLNGNVTWTHLSRSPEWDPHSTKFASLYVTDTAPDTIVKAFDYEPSGGILQFYTMAMLEKRLRQTGATNVSAPRQYALFRERATSHDTIVMERKDGEPISEVMWEKAREIGVRSTEYTELKIALEGLIASDISQAVTNRKLRRVLINDLGQGRNVLIDGDAPFDIEHLRDHQFVVLDQPHSTGAGYQVAEKVFSRLTSTRQKIRELRAKGTKPTDAE